MTPLRALENHRMSLPDPMPPSPMRQLVCVRPGCERTATQRHHIVKRKEGGDFIIIDGLLLVQAVADLCSIDHEEVESKPWGTRARIRWLDSGWGWYIRGERVPVEHTAIYWLDEKTETAWAFRGFLKGDFWLRPWNQE